MSDAVNSKVFGHKISWGTDPSGRAQVAHAVEVQDILPVSGNVLMGFCDALNAPPRGVAGRAGSWWSPNVWGLCTIPTSADLIASGALTQAELDAYSAAKAEAKRTKDAPWPAKPRGLEWCDRAKDRPHRTTSHWLSASAVAVDVDWQDASVETKDGHKALPPGVRKWVPQRDEKAPKPGHIMHATPRGMRVIYVLDQPCTDMASYKMAVAGAIADVKRWVQTIEFRRIHGEEDGFAVDDAVKDPSRILFAPWIGEGPKARDEVARIVGRSALYTVGELAALAPTTPEAPAIEGGASVPASGRPKAKDAAVTQAIEDAVERFNRDHAATYGTYPAPSSGECPVCHPSDRRGWGALPGSDGRWYCWHAGHVERAKGCEIGRQKPDGPGHFGDALDLYIWATYRGEKSSADRVWVLTETRDPSGAPYLDSGVMDAVDFKGRDPKTWVYDQRLGRFRSPDPLKGGAWDHGISRESLAQGLAFAGLDKRTGERFMGRIPTVRYALPIYDSPSSLVERGGSVYLSTYVPSALAPVEGDWDPIRRVLLNLCSGREEYLTYTLDWLATFVQSVRAGRPLRLKTAIAFYGAKGAGKGVMTDVLKALLGPGNVNVVGQEQLDASFNAWADGYLFIVGNEVLSSSNKDERTKNKIKTWVTDGDRQINQKNAPLYKADPHDVFWFFSNSEDRAALDIEPGDRRFTVFRVAGVIQMELGAQVAEDAARGGPMVAAFLDHLLKRASKVKPHMLLETEEKTRMVYASGNSALKFAMDAKELGLEAMLGPWRDKVHAEAVRLDTAVDYTYIVTKKDGTRWVTRQRMVDIYTAWARANNYKVVGAENLYRTLRTLLGLADGQVKKGGVPQWAFTGIPENPDALKAVEDPEPVRRDDPLEHVGV